MTFSAATGENPQMSGAGTVHGCLVATSSGNGGTFSGIDCLNYICGAEGNRTGIIYLYGSSGWEIANATITSSMTTGQGEFACGGVRIQSSGADNVEVRHLTMSGHFGHTFLVESASGSSGIAIHDNTVTETGQAGSTDAARIFCVKSATTNGAVAFYNNRVTSGCESGKDGPMLFTREPSANTHVYVFNNICVGCSTGVYGAINTQDNVTPFSVQNVDVFNNTVTGGGPVAVAWQNYFSAQRVINNIFDGPDYMIRGYTSDTNGASHASLGDQIWSTGTDKFTYNILENSTTTTFSPSSSEPPSGFIDITGSVQSTGAQTSRDGSNHLTASTGVATNDPLGQGAGVCAITAAGLTISCNVDINGISRGTTWDVGADQYEPGTPIPAGTQRRSIVRLGP
jgi:hypothetical protein